MNQPNHNLIIKLQGKFVGISSPAEVRPNLYGVD
jgi:hypothetical protein